MFLSILWLAAAIIGICISIAPLLIWRNTNRTNRLLALQLAKTGVAPEDVRRAWSEGGSHLPAVPGYENTGILGAAKDAAQNFKAAYSEAKVEDKPVPVPPKNRFCHRCGTDDAPLDATTCPGCGRELAARPLYCPKCGHEISHKPSECPGCGVGLKWKEAAS